MHLSTTRDAISRALIGCCVCLAVEWLEQCVHDQWASLDAMQTLSKSIRAPRELRQAVPALVSPPCPEAAISASEISISPQISSGCASQLHLMLPQPDATRSNLPETLGCTGVQPAKCQRAIPRHQQSVTGAARSPDAGSYQLNLSRWTLVACARKLGGLQ